MSRKDINLHSILRKVLFCFVFFFPKPTHLNWNWKFVRYNFIDKHAVKLQAEIRSRLTSKYLLLKFKICISVFCCNIKASDSYSRGFPQNKLHWNDKTGVYYNDFTNVYFLWSHKLTANYLHNILYLLYKLLHVSAIYSGHVPRFTSLVALLNCTLYMATKFVTPWRWPGYIADICRSSYSKYNTLCNYLVVNLCLLYCYAEDVQHQIFRSSVCYYLESRLAAEGRAVLIEGLQNDEIPSRQKSLEALRKPDTLSLQKNQRQRNEESGEVKRYLKLVLTEEVVRSQWKLWHALNITFQRTFKITVFIITNQLTQYKP